MHVDPDSVRWTFDMKVSEHKTLGGKVIQVFGTELGDMVVSGKFGRPSTKKGENAAWEAQDRFITQVLAWVDVDAETLNSKPLRFLYPSKKWDFKVYIKGFRSEQGSFEHNIDNINPGWVMTLFIQEDSTGVVVKGIKDMYLSRLMNGVGWKQTKYNGPSQDLVEQRLFPFGGSVYDYLADPIVNPTGQMGAP